MRAKLNDPSAIGEREDQLRGPLENLITDINALIGKAGEAIKAIGEVRLPDLMTRPDYAVTRDGLIGFIEVKAPGKGSDPSAFPAKSADRLQWEKLKSLPNIRLRRAMKPAAPFCELRALPTPPNVADAISVFARCMRLEPA